MDKRVQELMTRVNAGEMTLQEALLEASRPTAQVSVDRVEAARSMSTIEELNKAYKRAASKMSATKKRVGAKYETHPSYIKYLEEFEMIKARKNELYNGVAAEQDSVLAAIQVGASDNAILQAFMSQMNDLFNNKLLSYKEKKCLTHAQLKELINKQDNKPSNQLLEKMDEYKEGMSQLYLQRSDKDQFVRKLNLLSNTILYIKRQAKEAKQNKEDK